MNKMIESEQRVGTAARLFVDATTNVALNTIQAEKEKRSIHLARCPECGGRPDPVRSIDGDTYGVICSSCGVMLEGFRTRAEADETWNLNYKSEGEDDS